MPPSAVLALLAMGGIGCWLYVRHAREAKAPLIDLRLLKVETFYASVVGGFLFRIGIGAMPFLLPLLFQLGFGMTPFRSGLLTVAGAIGAVTMKTTAARILRRFGFRRVLVVNALISSGFLAASALFMPGLAAHRHLRRAARWRLLQVAAIHEHQHARLCRHRAEGR